MKDRELLDAGKVHSISTKFFYRNNKLCFQIMVIYDNRCLVREFKDYNDYKKHHDYLVRLLNDKKPLPNIFRQAG